MLKSQIAAQGKAFEESGGFSERLHTHRLEAPRRPARHRTLTRLPAMPTAHAPEKIREGGALGMHRVS